MVLQCFSSFSRSLLILCLHDSELQSLKCCVHGECKVPLMGDALSFHSFDNRAPDNFCTDFSVSKTD